MRLPTRSLQHLLTSLLLACLFASPTLQALENTGGVRSLRAADVHPEDYPTVQAMLFMHQRVNRSSAGKLAIQVFPSGLLGDEAPLLRLVQSGELDMNRISAQALDGLSPLTRVLSLPYLFRDSEHQHKVLDGPIGREVLDSLRTYGLIGLAFYDSGTRNLYSSKKPVQRLEDLKDLEIRVQPSDLSMAVFEKLGAKPVKLPFSQTGNALSNGLISAAENNLPSYSSTEHYKHAPYYTFSRHTMTPDVLVVSRISWDKLTPTEQALLRTAATESVPMMRDMWQQREERVEATLRLAGVKFVELPREQLARFAEAVQPLYAQFTGSPPQQDLIKRIRAVK
ncbi:TRAP transporter substrate-binding protein [Uliginosibacterium sp. 31-12]|uniref:TRAP transporter substrate-binding protein n=1 Tax=Uliginosibacterium sp. 31-12 TaxID=3062781 RepID=UPI0026E3E68C|nr:TRAP transporter substrate-binding protein [Uliginosibacterium sp. 31-12]MDO6384962.1 TRAP transporter substrate-binding protein [Uliginosibacterium sp. 31-12]